jgi:hypothetical protein
MRLREPMLWPRPTNEICSFSVVHLNGSEVNRELQEVFSLLAKLSQEWKLSRTNELSQYSPGQ